MTANLVLLVFAGLLTIGQGRVALGNWRVKRAGWGNLSFAEAENRKGFLTMAAVDLALFVGLCIWFALGAKQMFT